MLPGVRHRPWPVRTGTRGRRWTAADGGEWV